MGYRHDSVTQKNWFSKEDLKAFENYYINKENFSEDDLYRIEAYNEKVIANNDLKKLVEKLEKMDDELLEVFKYHHKNLIKELLNKLY